MKLNKKLVAMMMVAAIGMTFVGCGSNDDVQEEGTQVEQPETEKEPEVDEEPEAEKEPEVDEEPEAEKEPEADKEPEAEKEPEVDKEPEAEKEPEADKEPEAEKEPEADKEPEAEKEPGADKEPEAEKEPEVSTGLSVQAVYDATIAGFVPGETMPVINPVDGALVADSYGIDTSILKSYLVHLPMMMTQATEIAIFEVQNEADKEVVKAGITKRVEALIAQWSTYLPDQLELVQNHKVVEVGNYVALIISDHAETMAANFTNAVK